MIKITTIIPVDKSSVNLEECLISLVNQSVKEIEVLILNCGTTKEINKIISLYLEKYNFIKCVKVTGKKTRANAINLGIKLAKGKYISILNSNDYIADNMYLKMLDNISLYKADVCACKPIIVTKKTSTLFSTSYPADGIYSINENLDSLLLIDELLGTKLFKKDIIDKNNLKMSENIFSVKEFIYKIIYKSNNISFIDKGLYYFKKDFNEEQEFKEADLFEFCDNLNKTFKEQELLIALCMKTMLENIKSNKKGKKLFNKCKCYLNTKFGVKYKNNKLCKIYVRPLNYRIYYLFTNDNLIKKFLYFNKKYLKIQNFIIRDKKRRLKKSPEQQIDSNLIRGKTKEIQSISLKILLEFDNICKKNNLRYFLSEGTLLGAIRDKGFIPWDDDIDVSMPREDFEKFIVIANEQLSKDYKLQFTNTLDNYWINFAKVRYVGKSSFEQKEIEHLTKDIGPFIDVFPLDYLPKESTFFQTRIAKKVKFYNQILQFKTFRKVGNFKTKCFFILGKIYSYNTLHNKINKYMTKYNHKKHNYIVNYGSIYNYKKQIFPMDYFKEIKLVNFEGYKLPVPGEYEKILTKIYGNYKNKVTLKEQTSPHLLVKRSLSNQKRKRIALVVDVDDWAYFNIAKNIMKNIGYKYDFKIISNTDSKTNIVKICYQNPGYDCYHFFWREALLKIDDDKIYNRYKIFKAKNKILKVNKEKFRKKYIEDKLLTFSIYSHMHLEIKNAKMEQFTKYAKNYTVSSDILNDIYSNLDNIPRPIMTITDGVDLNKFYPQNLERFDDIKSRKIVIGWVGNSKWCEWMGEDMKGVHVLLKPAVEELIKEGYNIELNLSDRNERFIPHDQMVDYYKTIDLYICTSKHEGTPNPVLESMACGVPVISTRVGIVPEAFGKLQQKYILKERTKDELKKTIIELISNPEEFKKLSDENLKQIKDWTWKKKSDQFDKFFEKVTSEEKEML